MTPSWLRRATYLSREVWIFVSGRAPAVTAVAGTYARELVLAVERWQESPDMSTAVDVADAARRLHFHVSALQRTPREEARFFATKDALEVDTLLRSLDDLDTATRTFAAGQTSDPGPVTAAVLSYARITRHIEETQHKGK